MLANAVLQLAHVWLIHRIREQARSHICSVALVNDQSLFETASRFRRWADLLQRSIHQQLPQFCHLLDAEHDCALGGVQVEGQIAGECV